jgi:hypothetical protein
LGGSGMSLFDRACSEVEGGNRRDERRKDSHKLLGDLVRGSTAWCYVDSKRLR